MSLRVYFSLFLLMTFIKTSAQNKKYCFRQVDSVLMSENSASKLNTRLTGLKDRLNPSRSNIRSIFNRDVDFGYTHQRIIVSLNWNDFKIDLLVKNDTIYAKVIRYYYSNTSPRFYDAKAFGDFDYLNLRNQFYHSSKSISDLLKELAMDEIFAYNCGENNSRTAEILYVEDLAKKKKVQELFSMLQSICVETQTYGVSGFEMLTIQEIDASTRQIIEHIRKRNSEIVSCSGCDKGFIYKVFIQAK